MTYIILGSFGFLLFFIYDINSIIWKNRMLHRCFFVGCMLLWLSTTGILWHFKDSLVDNVNRYPGWLASALIFTGLLIHSLFFALPFKKTYINDVTDKRVYTKGVYALCRHPGVLWFIGLYLSIYFLIQQPLMLAGSLVFCFWNLTYIIFQDLWTFPRTFHDYGEYSAIAPFLIPNHSSIRRWLSTMRVK